MNMNTSTLRKRDALSLNMNKICEMSNRVPTSYTTALNLKYLLKVKIISGIQPRAKFPLALPLGSSRIRRDNDGILPLWNVLFDPLQHGRFRVQIVHRDVKEALDLGGMQIHRYNVICARHR